MKNSDWASVIAALGLGSVGFWFWRKSRQLDAAKVKAQQSQASTAQSKTVAKVSSSAIQAVVKELNKPMVAKAAKLDSSVLKRMMQSAVRDEKHTGTLGALIQWGTIVAVTQEQQREANFGQTWADGVLGDNVEARASVTPTKKPYLAAFITGTGWTQTLKSEVGDSWPLTPGPAGRCAFPMVGSDLTRIGSTPFLVDGDRIPFGDGWVVLPGPFEAKYPIDNAMEFKQTFKRGLWVDDRMLYDGANVRFADTAWGRSFQYDDYKVNKGRIGLAMPPVPPDCKTKAQIEHWIVENGGYTNKMVGDKFAKALEKAAKAGDLVGMANAYKVMPKSSDKGLSDSWKNWYNTYGRAMRISRNLVQAAESWRVTAYQHQLLKTIKWTGKDKAIYDTSKSKKIESPSGWKEHCLAWGCGVATADRAMSHWTPALGFRWYEGKDRGWKTAPAVYPDPRTDIPDLLKYVMKLTPPPGSKWINHKEPLGRTIDTTGWVGWNWPIESGSLYPHYRQTPEVLQETKKRFDEWYAQENPGPMSKKERALRVFKVVTEAISTIVSVYAGGVPAITMTMTNMLVENVTSILASGFGGNKVVGALLGIAHTVAGYATNQSWDTDPAGKLDKALRLNLVDPIQAMETVQSAVSDITNWKNINGWGYGSDLIGKFTDVPKQYQNIVKNIV